VNYKDIPLVIFAGGKSSRMGEDKALLPFSSSPTLTEFQLQRFQNIFKKVYISCENKSKFKFDANFIEDIDFSLKTPFVGLYSCFEKLESDYIFTLSVDTPFVKSDTFKKLFLFNSYEAVVPITKRGYQPLCALYKRSIKPKLKELIKEERLKFSNLYDKIDVKYVEFQSEEDFDNLNFKDEYNQALKRIAP